MAARNSKALAAIGPMAQATNLEAALTALAVALVFAALAGPIVWRR
jgi:hypothetical protein